MKTKAEAEARLAELPLRAPVSVADRGGSRREFTYIRPDGGQVSIEIDASPTSQQLDDLANHLPLDSRDIETAKATLKRDIAQASASKT